LLKRNVIAPADDQVARNALFNRNRFRCFGEEFLEARVSPPPPKGCTRWYYLELHIVEGKTRNLSAIPMSSSPEGVLSSGLSVGRSSFAFARRDR
jgi:hypothetical protein